jgi:hypothetical protein
VTGTLSRPAGTVALLSRDEWWAMPIRESLAEFVTPRGPAIRELLGEASALLGYAPRPVAAGLRGWIRT